MQRMADYNWTEIAECLGGRVVRRTEHEVEIIGYPYGHLVIAENGGEVNVLRLVPVGDGSVPYWSHDLRHVAPGGPVGAVDSLTLAVRKAAHLRGEPIPYRYPLTPAEVAAGISEVGA